MSHEEATLSSIVSGLMVASALLCVAILVAEQGCHLWQRTSQREPVNPHHWLRESV